ncbi:ABC transporter ATP-binding protein/permease [Mucilaginibacter roseus]|uniref:ABC transporter ATP-binding protein/permease n=1 Tax=Mucilaginibacter roseus TaxID=1528868 RepID=A0ABS8U3A8_9SPHI|nr:ABC transporter ATP-binding protein [Mucilaginibacter roseus]MCD8740550.1 ABC transporter ATP-binding protein/permease [Mucilaginibacter roseus]
MKLNFKNNFIGYFQFYYNVIGNRLLLNTGLGIMVSFLDGMGLAMFMPLLQSVSDTGEMKSSGKSMGKLHFLTDAITSLGFQINLNSILVVLVLLFAVKGGLKFFQQNGQVQLWFYFMRRIRFALLAQLQGLTYRNFLKLDTGRIQNTLTGEVGRLNQTVKFYFNAIQAAVMLLTYVVLAFLANYQFALIVGVGAGISSLLYRRIYRSTKSASLSISKTGNQFNKLITQSIYYFKYLKSTNYFARFSDHIKGVIRDSEEFNKKMGYNAAITNSVKEPVIIIIVAGVIYLQVSYMGTMLSTILLSLLLFYRALMSLVLVQNFWQSFIQNSGSMDSIATLYTEMAEGQEHEENKAYKGFEQGIQISNSSFSYDKVKQILDRVNISIPKNKTVAFVGESGSGKTTLANILVGLLKPDSGELLVDGDVLNQYNLNSFRNRIGYISQEAVVFNDNIYNNITFWAERTPENLARFNKAVELASLTAFIDSLPDKENTMLGDHGTLVSGGQKQRISIARELYKDADILILDEATSALDSETERVIQDNIEKLHGTYTMIIIAHRLSTIKNADTIYLLEQGKVAANGTFDEMVETSERFRRMVELQEV